MLSFSKYLLFFFALVPLIMLNSAEVHSLGLTAAQHSTLTILPQTCARVLGVDLGSEFNDEENLWSSLNMNIHTEIGLTYHTLAIDDDREKALNKEELSHRFLCAVQLPDKARVAALTAHGRVGDKSSMGVYLYQYPVALSDSTPNVSNACGITADNILNKQEYSSSTSESYTGTCGDFTIDNSKNGYYIRIIITKGAGQKYDDALLRAIQITYNP